MSEEECAHAIAYGMMAVEPGIDALAVGEMGIANTTVASALCMGLFGGTAAEWTGQTVTARLWEDPFVAADKEVREYLQGKSQVSVWDSFARLARGLGNGPLVVLPVFVPGGSYPESGEVRLRMRYAVAARP